MNGNTGRPHGKPWTAEQDAKLQDLGRMPRDLMPWANVAAQFEGRTSMACRQRFMLLRAGAGKVAPRARERKVNGRICHAPSVIASMQAPPDPARMPRHKSLTAALLGDPLPGRSALDRRNGAGA